ncbi:MAG TPA: hypothetical protein DCQ58_04015 [Saprospirales bacterium]|nr:hypothetical protein [Saprospirales bacterium]
MKYLPFKFYPKSIKIQLVIAFFGLVFNQIYMLFFHFSDLNLIILGILSAYSLYLAFIMRRYIKSNKEKLIDFEIY